MQPQLLRRGGKLPKKEVCFSGLSLGLSSSGVKQQLEEMGVSGPQWGSSKVPRIKSPLPRRRPGVRLLQGSVSCRRSSVDQPHGRGL